MIKKIFLVIFLVLNFQAKHRKKIKQNHQNIDNMLLKVNPQKAVKYLTNFKKLSGNPAKIQFSTVTALVSKGYKKEMRKLFERKAFLISAPYTTEKPSMNKFFLQSVVGILGLRYGAKKYHNTHLQEQIDELSKENGEVIQHNMVLKLSRQNTVQEIDDMIERLDESFEGVSQRLMKQAYDLKSTIDFSLNHVQRKLLDQPVDDEEQHNEHTEDKHDNKIQLNLSKIDLQTWHN